MARADEINLFVPTDLRTEYYTDPIAVSPSNPRLSWTIANPPPSFEQASYRITADVTREALLSEQNTIWDSGDVESLESSQIEYDGASIPGGGECWWRVQVRDTTGMRSTWSEPARWIADVAAADMNRAEWIRYATGYTRDEAVSPCFRTTFTLHTVPTRAIVYVGSAGYNEFYVNGHKVDSSVLTPAVSNFKHRTLYSAYDVAPLLAPGANCFAAWLGRGWYIEPKGSEPILPSGPRLQALCRIEMGRECLEIVTNDTWRAAPSPYTTVGEWHFGRFGGERYDARLEMPGWNSADFDDSSWTTADVAPAPSPLAVLQACPSNRIGRRLPAVACETLPDGRFRLDFGTDVTGWLSIKLPSLAPGTLVRMECADSGGGVYTQVDEFIASGRSTDAFCQKFSYHGFRTVTIEGLKFPPPLANAEALLIETDFEVTGTFACSNELFNRIHEMHVWTARCLNLGGYTVDCPHRERLGYGAEGQAPLGTMVYNFWTPTFYTKWLEDWQFAQDQNIGDIAHTAPYRWGGGGPCWGGILALVTWRMYVHYGDKRVLAENYVAMRRYLDFLNTISVDDVVQLRGEKWDVLADWVAPGRGMEDDGSNWPSPNAASLFTSCYRIYLWQIQCDAANALGHATDAVACDAEIARMRTSVHQAFYDAETETYALGEQAYWVMPLLTGVVPEALRESVNAKLRHRIDIECDGHLDTGVLGTYFLIEYLQRTDQNYLLFKIASQTTYPSWGYMLAQGATTAWEQWNGGAWSYIHASYISLDSWFYESIAGIRPDPAWPGFEHVVIKPQIVGDMTWASATHRTIRGVVESSWLLDGDTVTLDVTIPSNTRATVHVPRGSIHNVGAGKHQFTSRRSDGLVLS